MTVKDLNLLFLQTKCEQLPLDRGYLKYRYHLSDTLYVHITLLEEKFEIVFVNYLSNKMYMMLEGTKSIGVPYTQYLSRQIHLYS